jgi:hypothetical protein
MKSLFVVSVALGIFSGTSFTANAQQSLRFIDGIELRGEATGYSVSTQPADIVKAPVGKRTATTAGSMATELCNKLQFKYAQLLDREVEFITNTSLFSFIDEWWATRYRYGGTTKSGIDCSAFTGLLMSTVFGLHLPRTAKMQYDACEKLEQEDMLEGDLVFFNTRGGVSHVGVYLGDGYFVHSSTSNGVTISNLKDTYYSRKFIGGGRVVDQQAETAKLL